MITRSQMEVATATVTAVAGLLAVVGGLELGVSWSSHGPEPGYFPFWIGLILSFASIWNGVAGALSKSGSDHVVSREQITRVAKFIIPIIVFVGMMIVLGSFVASAVYLIYVSHWQGHLRLMKAVMLGIGFSLALYIVFEVIFLVPLHKGPLEAALGIY